MARGLNLEEVGRLAGVSRSTVSRVLNGEPNVSEAARAQVQAIIAQTGYRPHAAARSLASRRTGLLGLVIASAVETIFDDPYFGRLMLGATRATEGHDLTMAMFVHDGESDDRSLVPRVVDPGMVDGVIVTASRMGDPLIGRLLTARMPFVIVGRPDEPASCHSVDTDNRGGARLAAEHVARLGRIRVAIVSAPSNSAAAIDRRHGFLEGLAGSGLSAEGRIAEGNWTEESGHAAMVQLLPSRPDAVLVASDRMAVGALRAIEEAGLTCPDDIALVSFDGLLPPDLTNPRLTCVVQPVMETGERAVELLHAVINGSVTEPQHIVLETELVVRESCGAR